uniref:Uncharacterized protein n=1 Tax=Romanomermis culicivorax TaxID=13658 RepID=A0A915JGX0_ROMCU
MNGTEWSKYGSTRRDALQTLAPYLKNFNVMTCPDVAILKKLSSGKANRFARDEHLVPLLNMLLSNKGTVPSVQFYFGARLTLAPVLTLAPIV